MRLGILTGGGDCPGLNALLRSVVRRGILEFGHTFVGIENGYQGLIDDGLTRQLTLEDVRGILPKGGTIIGTSNRANPFQYPQLAGDTWTNSDRSADAVRRYRELELDGVIAVGGDGTLSIAHRLSTLGMNVVGCPKTIDNDLSGTDLTFGFDTARGICTEAIDRLHSTAEAHARVMIVEMMGRHAGFLTFDAGIAGGADVILLPEIPYRQDVVVETIHRRSRLRRPFSIVAISEGAFPEGGTEAVLDAASDIPGRGVVRLGGSGKVLADMLAEHVDAEIRVTVLGHLQRGGSPSAADRLLATQFGCHALDLIAQRSWGNMVVWRDGRVGHAPLSESRKERRVDPRGDRARHARGMGISLGDQRPS